MRDHNYFEKYARDHQMSPVGYVDTPEGRVLLADSERAILENGRIVYRTAYCIYRDGADIANFNDYEISDTEGSKSAQQNRLNDALVHARTLLKQLTDSGYYDDGRKGDFSPRPRN